MSERYPEVRHEALCRDCEEWSKATPQEAKRDAWVMTHASATGHTRYSIITERYLNLGTLQLLSPSSNREGSGA